MRVPHLAISMNYAAEQVFQISDPMILIIFLTSVQEKFIGKVNAEPTLYVTTDLQQMIIYGNGKAA